MDETLNGFPAMYYKDFNIVESGSEKLPYNIYYKHCADTNIFGSWVDGCQSIEQGMSNIDSGVYTQYAQEVNRLANEGKIIPNFINNIYTRIEQAQERYKKTQDKKELLLMEALDTVYRNLDVDERTFMIIEHCEINYPEHFNEVK